MYMCRLRAVPHNYMIHTCDRPHAIILRTVQYSYFIYRTQNAIVKAIRTDLKVGDTARWESDVDLH